ncbi:MAG: cytochrome c biogenesis protein DipZ [Candidatus Woesebacteria bacterium]
MLILIIFAFLAGIVTVLSPCILPVLPIVLSGSLTGGKKRPLGIVTGFIISFTFFTLLLSAIVKATGISSEVLRTVSIIVIGLFGVSLLVPQTQILLEKLFAKISGLAPRSTGQEGFGSGVIIGLSLGLLWTPCVGPILASVITLALTGSTNASAFFITFAYSLGTGLPMLAITYGGRQLLQRVPWLLRNTATIQKAFGVLMIAMAIALYANIDRKFQTIILTTFPNYGTGLTAIENNPLVQKELGNLGANPGAVPSNLSDQGAIPNPTFSGGGTWINSEPLNFNTNLKGKVVLVDFWTYSCINCIRTLPYLKDWYAKYKDKGFVIIGVHSPEFEFEKNTENVTMAVKDFGIEYPVVQDNDLLIWNSYQNQYWPAHYLVDSRGHLRDTHFGEGAYAETERNIQALLKEAGDTSLPEVTTKDPASGLQLRLGDQMTPETYLGSMRAQSYTSTENPDVPSMQTMYDFTGTLENDKVGIRGKWSIEDERITSNSDSSTLSLNFNAGKVYLVLGGKSNKPVTIKLDGNRIEPDITVTMDKKYDVVDLGDKPGRHTVELTVPSGISAYAFTFGE